MLTVPSDCVVRYLNEDCLGGLRLLENEDIEIVWRDGTVTHERVRIEDGIACIHTRHNGSRIALQLYRLDVAIVKRWTSPEDEPAVGVGLPVTSLVSNSKTVVDVDIEDLVYRRPRFQITEREKIVMAAYRELASRGFTFLGFSIVDNDRITWSGVHPDGYDVCDDWPYPVDTPAT